MGFGKIFKSGRKSLILYNDSVLRGDVVKFGGFVMFDDNTFYEQDRVQLFMVSAKFSKLRGEVHFKRSGALFLGQGAHFRDF